MSEYTYNIILQTQLGDKHGKLQLNVQGHIVKGVIEILGNSSPCSGEIDKHGHCSLRGQLKTFMSTIGYSGEGYADSQKVNFELSDSQNRFFMIGEACQPEP